MKEGFEKGVLVFGLFLLLISFWDTVSAATYYVNVTGLGTECTLVSPCNLSYVQANVVPGSTVYFVDGNYGDITFDGSSGEGNSTDWITYQSINYSGAVISSMTFTGSERNSYLVFNNLKFDSGFIENNPHDPDGKTTITLDNVNYINFTSCYLEGAKNNASYLVGKDYFPYSYGDDATLSSGDGDPTNILVDNCTFKYGHNAVRVRYGYNWTITNNEISEVSDNAIQISGGGGNNTLIKGNRIHHGNSRRMDLCWTGSGTPGANWTTYNSSLIGQRMVQDVTGSTGIITSVREYVCAGYSGMTVFLYADNSSTTPSRSDTETWFLESNHSIYWTPVATGDSAHSDLISIEGTGSNIMVDSNILYETGDVGQAIKLGDSGGYNVNTIIQNNVIFDDDAGTYLLAMGAGINTTIRNNIIDAGSAHPLRGIRCENIISSFLYNNIISGAVYTSGTINASDYNIWGVSEVEVPSQFRGWNSTYGASWSNLVINREDGTYSSFNYSIKQWSAAIDAADPTNAPTYDIEGSLRGDSPDIGAYESSFPFLSIAYPENITYFSNRTQINYNSVDASFCWYSTNGGTTNSSAVTAGTNWTGLNLGSSTLIVYCNRTDGSINHSSVTFTVTPLPDLLEVNYSSGTPSNASTTRSNYSFVNVTANATAVNVSTFIDFDNSLVSWWRMDDVNATGGLVNRVNGGKNCSLIATANQTSSGYLGAGLAVDGDSDMANCGTVMLNRTFTVSVWVKHLGTGAVAHILGTQNSGYRFDMKFGVATGIYANIGNGTTNLASNPGNTNYPYQNDTWYLVNYVVNTTSWKMYVNGKFNASGTYSENVPVFSDSVSVITFGSYRYQGGQYWNGTLDDVMLFNRSLSAEEIAGLYANQSTKYVSNNFTNLSEGVHTFRAYAQDNYGNLSYTDERVITYNASAQTVPFVSILYPTNTTYSSNRTQINYTVTDGEFCWYSTNGGTTNSSAVSAGANWTGLNLGGETVTVYCNSSDGGVNSSSVIFGVDTVAPSVEIVSPTSQTYTSSTVLFNVTASDTNGISSCWYSLNSGVTNITTTNTSTESFNATNASMTNGTHSVRFYCNDTLGNLNSSAFVSFNVDITIVPFIAIIYPTNTTYPSNAAHINYTQTDASFCWYSTNSGITNSSSVTAGTNWTGLNLGSSTLTVYCNSSDGTVNSTNVVFGVDTIAPVTSAGTNAGGNASSTVRWITNNVTVTLSCTDATACSDTYYCNDTANSCDPWAGTEYSSPFNISSDGINYVRYASNDSAGNIEDTNIYVVKKAENAPAPNWTQFQNSLTTNLTEQGYTNITNLTIGVANKSKIRFLETVDLVDYDNSFNEVDLDSHVNCSDKLISVNSTALSMLNVSAELTFYNITFSEPQVHKDGAVFNGYNLSQSPNESNDYAMIINVSGFSTYEVVEGASDDTEEDDDGSPSGGGGGSGTPTYNLNENNLLSGFTVVLGNNFKVKISLVKETHLLTVNEILNNSIRITISSNPVNLTIGIGETGKADLNSDGYYDLSIYLENVRYNRASVTLKSINEYAPPVAVQSNSSQYPKDISNAAGELGENSERNDVHKRAILWKPWLILVVVMIGIVFVIMLVMNILRHFNNKSHIA